MYTSFTPPFILIRNDGWAAEFSDLVTLCSAIREAKICVEKYHVVYFHDADIEQYIWIVRDDNGNIVTQDDICNAVPRRRDWLERHNRILTQAAVIGLPIPYTGKKRHGGYFRAPKTFNILKSISAIMVDERHSDIRPKGKIKIVPNSWDDITKSSNYNRNWKRNRKTKWKNK